MKYYNLTNPQMAILKMEQYYKGTNINNICGMLTIKQEVDLNILNKAINIFVKNNKSFGLRLTEKEGETLQFFTESKDTEYEKINLKGYKEVQKLAKEVSEQVFDIYDKELYKFVLFKLENGHGGFIVLTHHIISDAATFGIMGRECVEIYRKLLKNEEVEKKDYSYENYILEEEEYMKSTKFTKDEEYWNNLYKEIPENAVIPGSKGEKYNKLIGKAERKEYIIDTKLLNQIIEFCRKSKISNFNFFMAIYAIYLSRVSNLKDFVIGTPILNRANFKEKNTTGMFINTAPLRINIENDMNFIELTEKIAESSLSMLRHQKYSYQMLLQNLRKREINFTSLFDVMLSYQITKANDKNIDIPYRVEWLETSTISNGLAIHLHDNNDEDKLDIAYDFQKQKYDVNDIENMHKRILYIIEQVLENESIVEKDIEIITPDEKNKILNEFNNTKKDYPKDKTVIQLFEEQVEKTPDNIAVVFEDKKLTYRELNEKANSLAKEMINNNVQYRDVVGVFMPRSIELVISIWAILKCGAIYMPLYTDYPSDRIDYMITNSKAKMILTNNDLSYKILTEHSIIVKNYENIENLKTLNKLTIMPNDTLYIIYTSGSTGKPKGVKITNDCLNNFIDSFNQYFEGVSIKDKFLASTNISFDVSIFELFLPLLKGASLILYNKELINDVIDYCDYIIKHEITGLYIPPNILEEVYFVLKDKKNLKIDKLLVGVEAIRKDILDKYFLLNPNMHIVNGYGPTETTICCASLPYYTNDLKLDTDIVPIGRALYNNHIYILDDNKKMQPIGTIGELYVTGTGVGAGYVNNKEETEKNYILNIFDKSSEKMYRTGDFGKWNKNGLIELSGRKDSQIKIKGFRIELNEINNKISEIDNIKNCTSIVYERKKQKIICSYYVSKDGKKINQNEIKTYLKKYLPNYMIPSFLMQIESLPLTINGKVDKKRLPEPVFESETEIIKPKNETETKLLEIFKNILNLEKISTNNSFFELGGDSLSAIKLIIYIQDKLQVKIDIQDLYDNPSISELSEFILSTNNNEEYLKSNMNKVDKKEAYHLSSAQKRIYYSTKMAGEDNILYNVPGSIIFDKKPDIEKLNKSFQKLIERHKILRTYFEEIENEIYQKIDNEISFKIEEITIENKSIEEIEKEFAKPFKLSKAPLFRACLVNTKNKYLLLFDMHHIICDGMSIEIFTKELSKLYNGESLPEISFDYIDYAEMEYSKLKNDKLKNHKDFWINEFKDDIPVLDFQTDFVRPSNQSFEGAKIYRKITPEFAKEIYALAKKLDCSEYMLLLSCYYILLFKYSGQEEIVCGTPVACRNNKELLDMMGMFVNTLPLKAKIEENLSFKDFLKYIKNNCIKAFEHQEYPFNELVKDLNIRRDTSRAPLFDTMFIYQNNGESTLSFNGIKASTHAPDVGISKFDFSLEIIPKKQGEISLNFEYCTKLFKQNTMDNLVNHYINIIKEIVKNPEEKIVEIDMLSEEEKHKILYEFNDTKRDYPKDKTIVELFEEQVEKTPENIAIVFEDKKLTYKELNEKANNLAWHLRNIGIDRNDIIAIMVNRSLELLVAIIAVLKSGAGYIPIDPNYPKDRTEYMIENSNCKLLLTSSALEKTIDFEHKVIIDLKDNYFTNRNDNLTNINKPDDISYIIYTSGSTGKPKGVVLKAKSLTNLAYFLNDYVCFFKDNLNISIASVTTASFDIFLFESLIALQKGLRVIIANEEEQRLPSKLNLLIKNNNVKAIQMTPSRMRIFLDNIQYCPNLLNLDYVVLAGEPLPDKLLKDLLDLGVKKVYNGYGPSETTVFSTFTDVTDYKKVNIGKPLYNTQMYILDKNLAPVPIGMTGELYIAGDGVGRGYLNNEEITKERFVPNPFDKGTVMYKTGDGCKFLDNGEIAYVERLDNQVKIRGLRIELEEIEAKLMEIPAIKKAKVIKQSVKNRDFISAYYVGNMELSAKQIRKSLSLSLPDYMIPSYFTRLNDFPYTPNGKIDKKALPLPNTIESTEKTQYVAPRNKIETELIEILEKILKIKNISMLDNFYDLGGDSLTTIALCTSVRQKLHIELEFREVMKHPIIEELAEIIAKAPSIDAEACSISKCEVRDFYPISSAQKRTYLASLMDENSTLYNIYGGILLDTMPDIDKLNKALNTIVKRHEVLRTYFEVVNKQIVQKVVDKLNVKIDIQDVNTNNPNELFYIYKTPFNLSKLPLFNVTLFKMPNGKALIMLDVHHIIFDGASLNNFIQELAIAYNGMELPKLEVSYKDFAVWENDKLESNGFEGSKKFWNEQFSGNIPTLNLPEIYPRPKTKSYEGTTYIVEFSKELTEKINNFANEHKVTPYMVMLSAYYVLLNKYTDDKDIIVGTPVSGRIYKELEPILGMFVNSIPLRNTILPNMKFKEVLENVKNTCIDAFSHGEYPFDMLVNDLKLPKNPSRSLLFDTMFIYQNNGINIGDFGGKNAKYIPPITNTSKFDISVEVLPIQDKLQISFEYCINIFDEIFIGNFAKAYENILEAVLKEPEIMLQEISTFEENLKNKVSYKYNKIDLGNKENINIFETKIEEPLNYSTNYHTNFTNENKYDKMTSEIYDTKYIAPRNEIEEKIANVFESLLSINDIGIDDNFFELGGDSLVAVNLQIELLKLNYNFTYADIFEAPTVRGLADKISNPNKLL